MKNGNLRQWAAINTLYADDSDIVSRFISHNKVFRQQQERN